MSFGDRLKAARNKADLTQIELAEKSGISLRSIQNWEKGVRKPSNIDAVKKVAEVLGVTASELLDEDEEFMVGVSGKYGSRGAKQAQELLAEVTGLFAGGELAEEDMREMVDAIQEAYLIAKRNNVKYTPKKYRSEEGDGNK